LQGGTAGGKEDRRLRNKLAFQKSEERFRQVVESAPNAIVMIDPTGLIEMVNAQTERVFGYARDELLGKSVEMLMPVPGSANECQAIASKSCLHRDPLQLLAGLPAEHQLVAPCSKICAAPASQADTMKKLDAALPPI
jgi:PAS domain-containing protein